MSVQAAEEPEPLGADEKRVALTASCMTALAYAQGYYPNDTGLHNMLRYILKLANE